MSFLLQMHLNGAYNVRRPSGTQVNSHQPGTLDAFVKEVSRAVLLEVTNGIKKRPMRNISY
jgi:hypothetical protein